MEDMTPYENLANAIILKAVKDYRQTKSERTEAELERFFRSDWFHILTRIDGEWLINKLRKEKTYDR
jgi:hypothetical protein